MNEVRQRTLNLNDLTAAWRMPEAEASHVAEPLMSDLRALTMPSYRDPAGIPYRGAEVFRELMDGRSIVELRAAYVTLRRLDAQSGVMDAIETAHGVVHDV